MRALATILVASVLLFADPAQADSSRDRALREAVSQVLKRQGLDVRPERIKLYAPPQGHFDYVGPAGGRTKVKSPHVSSGFSYSIGTATIQGEISVPTSRNPLTRSIRYRPQRADAMISSINQTSAELQAADPLLRSFRGTAASRAINNPQNPVSVAQATISQQLAKQGLFVDPFRIVVKLRNGNWGEWVVRSGDKNYANGKVNLVSSKRGYRAFVNVRAVNQSFRRRVASANRRGKLASTSKQATRKRAPSRASAFKARLKNAASSLRRGSPQKTSTRSRVEARRPKVGRSRRGRVRGK